MTKAKFAGLTLAMSLSLAACAPAPSTVAPTPTEAPTAAPATTAPTGDPSTPATDTPSASPTAGASGAPTPGASAPAPDPSARVIVSGSVRDLAGATVNGATVRMRSLDASVPYEATTTTASGSYVFNGVPAGANVEVVVTRDGWTTRRRVASFQVGTQNRNVLDFGGGTGAAGAYFISKYPEIVRTEPVHEASGIDPVNLSYKLVVSEPLDEKNRERLTDAIRILPANDAANGGNAGTTDLDALEDDSYPLARTIDGVGGIGPYALKDGTNFLRDNASKARVTWNAEGTEATLRFPGVLSTGKNDEGEYQVVLVSDGSSERIQDSDGNQLGTDANGRMNTYPARGEWLLGAFTAKDLRLEDITGLGTNSAEARWAATHDNVATFEVKRDTTEPKLVSVDSTVVGNDTRIELTFTEPMATFDGTATGFRHPALGDDAGDLTNYSFMLGARAADLDSDLDGDPATTVDPTLVATYGGTDSEREREFRFDPNAFAASRTGAPLGSVVVEVDGTDPKTVFLYIVGRPNFFPNAARAIKARVERVGDPAGNRITDKSADDNSPVGTI